MKTAYPQYRMTQWIDTSEEAMNKPQATIIYGVQTMREKGGVVDEHDIVECHHCGRQWTVPCNFDEDYA